MLGLLWLRLLHPDVVTEGMVFIGKRVELFARTGYARLVLGRWVHVGDENRLRAHEGTLRVGDKCVFGRDNTVNCYLDVEIGAGTIVADWVYVCDFDHVYDDIHVPIKDQGIVKSPVRIGPDCWVGAKVTVLRGSTVGRGCVLAAHTVVRGDVPPMSIVTWASSPSISMCETMPCSLLRPLIASRPIGCGLLAVEERRPPASRCTSVREIR